MTHLKRHTKFEELKYLEYRGYVITISSNGLDSLNPEIRSKIFQSKELYEKDQEISQEIYTNYKDVTSGNNNDFKNILKISKEWIDMYETFNYWL